MTIQHSPSTLSHARHPLRIVLIGTSLEGESDGVVRAGLAVARAAGAKVYLVHAAQPELGLGGDRGDREEAALELAQAVIASQEAELDRQIERLEISRQELAGAAVQTGSPYRILVDAARTARADLIVVGATGSGKLAAELLGSTADRVLRKATVPVLLVRGELRLPLRRVLAPVDLSTLSGDAFRCGLDLVGQIAAPELEVRTLYAVGLLETLAKRGDEGLETATRRVEQEATAELRRFVLENRTDAPARLETGILRGEARFEILNELEKRPADLILLGTHGRGGLDRLVLGSVAATVARKASCSVLMISPEAALAEDIAENVENRFAPAFRLKRTG